MPAAPRSTQLTSCFSRGETKVWRRCCASSSTSTAPRGVTILRLRIIGVIVTPLAEVEVEAEVVLLREEGPEGEVEGGEGVAVLVLDENYQDTTGSEEQGIRGAGIQAACSWLDVERGRISQVRWTVEG